MILRKRADSRALSLGAHVCTHMIEGGKLEVQECDGEIEALLPGAMVL